MQMQRKKSFEIRLRKTGFVLFTFGVSCLLLIAFVFGVMVGKNIESYPEKITGVIPGLIKKKIAAAPISLPDVAVRPEDVRESSDAATTEDVRLTFYDNLTGKKAARDSAAEKVFEERPSPVSRLVEQGRPTVAEKPVVGKENVIGSDTPHSGAKFILRVASLKDEAKARELQKSLLGLGYQSNLEFREVDSKGKFYRVNLAGFGTREEAEKVAEIVKKKTSLDCLITSGE